MKTIMGGPYAELIRSHQARLFAFLCAGTASQQAAASLFGETFRLMATTRVDLDPDVDLDVMVYRYALRVRNRFEVPAPDPSSELSRMFDGIEPDDRLAFVLLSTSELAIADAATALRRPEPRLKKALAHGLVTMTRATVGLEPVGDDATSDEMVARAALGWLDADDRKLVEADPTAAPRRAAMEGILARVRELVPPCAPPEEFLARVDAAVEKCLRESPETVAPRSRRSGRVAAIAIGVLVLLGGASFAAVQLRGAAMQEDPIVVEDIAVEDATEPAPAPSLRAEPKDASAAIEVAAQGPAAQVDPRLDKATTHAKHYRCKKAVKLFAKLVDDSPAHLPTAIAALARCRSWLRKHRSDPKIKKLAHELSPR